MKLVIVESPSKAKTIEKYLGKGYKVHSSKGHVVDLPESGLGVDVDHDYKPEYQVKNAVVLKDLKAAFKGAEGLVLAVDPDREGEAIGWHVARELGVLDKHNKKKPGVELERIVFTEITEKAVQAAIENPRQIDMQLVNAQQARRILDRLVGYKLSPLLWKKIRYGLSAGRVQSVAVRLIVDREHERDAFDAKEYWSLAALVGLKTKAKEIKTEYELKKQDEKVEAEETETESTQLEPKKDQLLLELYRQAGKEPKLLTKKQTAEVVDKAKKADWIVGDIKQEQQYKNPSAPFTTSTLQQSGVNKFGFSAQRTMRAAQKLYEAGLITYMRTDSLAMSADAVQAARGYLGTAFGKDSIPEVPNAYKNKSKNAQEAHEAIRPTKFDKSASEAGLAGDEARLYDLIRARALGSQMSKAVVQANTLLVNAGDSQFRALAKKILKPGYLQVYKEDMQESELPDLKVGSQVFPEILRGVQHFTQPPARYTEASLIKELEKLGIGRPSTYAPIIQTIQSRKYVEKLNKYFTPTDTGIVVTKLLVKHFPDIVDVGFTAGMEDELDDVADGKLDWVKMLDKFYKPFAKEILLKEKKIDKAEFTVLGKSDEKCPICGKPMQIKLGRFGKFLSCSDFPNCKGMLPFDDGNPEHKQLTDTDSKEFKETYKVAPRTEDGRDYVVKIGRFGQFWAHPDYPKVKDAKPLEMQQSKLNELYGEAPKTDDGRNYLLKSGRFGKFWSHPDYPKVKDIVRIKKSA